jgi:hypothetical protein
MAVKDVAAQTKGAGQIDADLTGLIVLGKDGSTQCGVVFPGNA